MGELIPIGAPKTYTDRELLEVLLDKGEEMRRLHSEWWNERITAFKVDKRTAYLASCAEFDTLMRNIRMRIQ